MTKFSMIFFFSIFFKISFHLENFIAQTFYWLFLLLIQAFSHLCFNYGFKKYTAKAFTGFISMYKVKMDERDKGNYIL